MNLPCRKRLGWINYRAGRPFRSNMFQHALQCNSCQLLSHFLHEKDQITRVDCIGHLSSTVIPVTENMPPPHSAPNTLPHPLPVGGVPLQQFAAMYPPQQLPPQHYYQQHQATATGVPDQLFHDLQSLQMQIMQIQNQQHAASQRNSTHVFAQAETMHLVAVKRVHIDKMKKQILAGGGSLNPAASVSDTVVGANAGGLAVVQKKNEAAASLAAVEAKASATRQSQRSEVGIYFDKEE